MKLYVTTRQSQKGAHYQCLCADLGHRVVILSFDKLLLLEILGCTLEHLSAIKLDEKVYIEAK